MRPDPRRGSLLIVVAGLSAILLAMATVFLSRIRGDGATIASAQAETQARIMLIAACQFIQESSRLGWGEEGFGWTDVRDGSIGPRGPSVGGSIPIPSWWNGGSYPNLPPLASRRWPYPGSVLRGEMAAWQRPPAAIRMDFAPNPVAIPPEATAYPGPGDPDDWSYEMVSRGLMRDNLSFSGGIIPIARRKALTDGPGSFDPQPVADDAAAFLRGARLPDRDDGRPILMPDSQGLAWFRVYREMPEDHDNDQRTILAGATVPCWHDTVPLRSHGVFIITCGSGPTRGYRFWDSGDSGYSPELEAVTAKDSQIFSDETAFRRMRQSERILWYRVEWSASQGGSFSSVQTYSGRAWDNDAPLGFFDQVYRGNPNQAVRSFAGSIQWIQRLDREPPRW